MLLAGITILLFSAGILLFCIIRGPEIQNRIIAVDALAFIFSMVIVLMAIDYSEFSLLDICLVYSLLAFADILILAKYFEKGELYK